MVQFLTVKLLTVEINHREVETSQSGFNRELLALTVPNQHEHAQLPVVGTNLQHDHHAQLIPGVRTKLADQFLTVKLLTLGITDPGHRLNPSVGTLCCNTRTCMDSVHRRRQIGRHRWQRIAEPPAPPERSAERPPSYNPGYDSTANYCLTSGGQHLEV